MKALVKSKNEPGLWLEDVEKPRIGINDVLIRVHRTGICGTDVHIFKWNDWARKTIPIRLVIGHEFVSVSLLAHPPLTAGPHPDLSVRPFSQRSA